MAGGKMTQQQQTMVAVVLFAVGGLYVYWNYLLKPTMAKIDANAATYNDLKAKIETAERQSRRLPALQNELAKLQVELSGLETQLPKDKDLPNILRTLTREAQNENLQFTRLAPKASQKQQYFEIIPFDAGFSGSLHNLARFLAALGQQDRIFSAQNITLAPSGTSAADTGVATLSITLTIQTYAYAG